MEILYFESLPSTNSELLLMSKKSAKDWTVIWTKNQTQGRTYSGVDWQSESSKNLAVSLLIKNKLQPNELIYFNQWVCVVLAVFLKNYAKNVSVKWPNDIIINHKKIAGLLIESHLTNSIRNMVIGIGLNINQKSFNSLPKATSLAIENGETYDITEIVSGLVSAFRENYHLIKNKSWQLISLDYHSLLYKKNKVAVFKKDGDLFNGIIKQVDEHGNLIVELEDETIKSFKHKEIELQF